MARPRKVEGLSPDTPFHAAAKLAVEVRATELFEHAAGVLDTSDIERVHDMRVASRRLRAVLEIFAPCFPRREHRRLLREVKDLADALGARRDPDVTIVALERLEAGLTEEDRPGVESYMESVRAGQERANSELAAALARVEESELRGRLLALAAGIDP